MSARLTFIHTSDWHLGRIYWGIGSRAGESAQWKGEAIRRVWQLAVEAGAAFVLVAGDIFDTETPAPRFQQELLSLLQDAPVPVVLIPGNHDVAAEGAIWLNANFQKELGRLTQVHLFLNNGLLKVTPEVHIYGCPVTSKHDPEDPTAWIPSGERGEVYRIGLAHGHWRGYFSSDQQDGSHPIDPHRTERAGLDYLALGDYHGYTPDNHAAVKLRAFYSGALEVGARDDVRAGHVLLVSFEGPGEPPVVQRHKVGRVHMEDWGQVLVQESADVARLRSRCEALPEVAQTILHLDLHGSVSPAVRQELDEALEQMRGRLLGLECDSRALTQVAGNEDFEALRLEALEAEVLQRLATPLAPPELGRQKGAETLASWSEDEEARQEAINLYYALLKSQAGKSAT